MPAINTSFWKIVFPLMLTPDTSYDVVVASTDPDGNGPTVSAPLTVVTPVVADTAPPDISGLRTECVTDTSMGVCWETDEPATSNLSFVNAATGGTATLSDGALVTTRCVALGGLAASVLFGAIWKYAGSASAFVTSAALALVAVVALAASIRLYNREQIALI